MGNDTTIAVKSGNFVVPKNGERSFVHQSLDDWNEYFVEKNSILDLKVMDNKVTSSILMQLMIPSPSHKYLSEFFTSLWNLFTFSELVDNGN